MVRRTEAARELAAQFEEVMVDEYQDSNYIQEYLLWAVSREEDGSCNRFMVGDMTEAIYSFRQARPEIFLEKYLSYSKEDGPRQRIDLSRNFRSRREVLDTVNDLFLRIMGQDLGGWSMTGTRLCITGPDIRRTGDAKQNCCFWTGNLRTLRRTEARGRPWRRRPLPWQKKSVPGGTDAGDGGGDSCGPCGTGTA